MRRHSDWIDAYVDLCRESEAPDKFHFWTAVSTVAGALRRKVWIDQRLFEWVPNFYIILVGPPGVVSKSTTISVGHSILKEVDGIKFGPQIITWQALAQALAQSTELIEITPGNFIPMSAVTISVSELGTFLDTRETQMIDLLTDLWDGKRGTVAKHTKTQGNDEIENPWVNFIACTTPAWLRKNVDENLLTGGLSSRIIWLYADEKKHLTAYLSRKIPVGFAQQRLWLLQDLVEIADLCGEMQLTADAYTWGEKWYADHYKKVRATGYTDASSGLVARAQTHLHKLAMIFSASEGNTLEITPNHLIRADKALQVIEAELDYIHNLIRETPQTRLSAEVVEYLRRHGSTPMSTCFRDFRWSGWQEFRLAVEAAVAAGYVEYDGNLLRRKSP